MARRTINRKLRRNVRTACWLAAVAASIVPPAFLASSGDALHLLWLALPVAVVAAGHRWMADEGGVPVLVYHSVSEESAWLPWAKGTSVTPATFERHMRALRGLGCTVVSTMELIEARRGATTLPKRPVIIHLDDGYLDNWVAALPLLRRHCMKATLFVSLDFIEDGTEVRPNLDDVEAARAGAREQESQPEWKLQWSGYLNWAELKAMDSSGVIDVQSHGIDHARVPTGQRIVDEVTPENWRRYAWIQWAAMSGNKSTWLRRPGSPLVPYGSPIYENGPALAVKAWRDGRLETQPEYEARVRDVLSRSREILGSKLGKAIEIFCWPYNTATPAGRRIAEETGYLATTGGKGENRAEEDLCVISRITALDRPLGKRYAWLDGLLFRARVRLGHGNYYWHMLLLPAGLLRRIAGATRKTEKRPK